MFKNHIEKGLFTFYWEEAQNSEKEPQYQIFSLQNSPKKVDFNKNTKMEEHSETFAKPSKQPKAETIYIASTEAKSNGSGDKQNREYLQPTKIDVSSKLAKQLVLKQLESNQIKHSQGKHKHQKSCKLPLIKSQLPAQFFQSPASSHSNQQIQKIIFKDQIAQAKQQKCKFQRETVKPNIQRSHQKNKNNKTIETHRLILKRQITKNIYARELEEGSKLTSRQLPPFSPRDVVNKRVHKDYFLLQKVMMERMQQVSRVSSIVSIGVASRDDHAKRWLKRKQQFLNLLVRNMSVDSLKG